MKLLTAIYLISIQLEVKLSLGFKISYLSEYTLSMLVTPAELIKKLNDQDSSSECLELRLITNIDEGKNKKMLKSKK